MKQKDRELIFNKYGGKCAYCGCDLQKGWHVDHLIPIRREYKKIRAGYIHKGTPSERWEKAKRVCFNIINPEMDCFENQMPACASCNINKHSGSLEDFRKLIEGFINSLNRDSVQYKISKRYGLIKEEFKPVVFYFEKLNK